MVILCRFLVKVSPERKKIYKAQRQTVIKTDRRRTLGIHDEKLEPWTQVSKKPRTY